MPSMARFGRAKKPPKPEEANLHANRHSLLPASPRVSLLHVEPQLNMHQYNGLFGAESPEPLSQAGAAESSPDAHLDMIVPPPSTQPNGSTHPTNGDDHNKSTTGEWSSAVGHAATGKSGRVIHNLQEEIARLTRECGVYRSRAEETQRMNEAYKTQVQNMTERLRNLEQANETNLHSIARKDKKIEELRTELKSEKDRRLQADAEKVKVNQLMDDARDDFHRKCADLQEVANHSRTQYDVLAAHQQRDRADQQKKLNNIREEIATLKRKHDEKGPQLDRLDEILAAKDREIEAGRTRFEKLFADYEAYKRAHDEEMGTLVEKGRTSDARIDAVLASLKETEGQMKWVMRVRDEVQGAE